MIGPAMHRFFLIAAMAAAALAPAAADLPTWTTNDGQMILRGVPQIPGELVGRLKRYQDARFATFVEWTRDGEGLYVRTRFGDISQLHRVEAPLGMRHQLTWFTEPPGQVVRRSKGRELAVTMDEGGGERDQILLFDPRTASTRTLTNDRSRNRQLLWSRNGRLLAFQSTRRNGVDSDLWIMDPDRPQSRA